MIAEAEAAGELKFVDSGRRCGRGIVRVALRSAVEAFCEGAAHQRLIALGLLEEASNRGQILQ